MDNRIVAGFQNTVDFEIAWNQETVQALIQAYEIQYDEIQIFTPVTNERELLCTLLCHIQRQSGSECLASSSKITREFANRFDFNVTLGGTAARAAMAIEKLGYRSTIHACSQNHYFRSLIPRRVHWVASVPDEGEEFHPHVIVQYPADAHLRVGEHAFVTTRPNRVIFAYDPPSAALHLADNFQDELCKASVFLAASFNLIPEEAVLRQRLEKTIHFISKLPEQCVVLMEDACFENPKMHQIVTQSLAPYLDIFSMNEDELQDRVGRRINVRSAGEVAQAVREMYDALHMRTVVCHSAYWALAYGRLPLNMKSALEAGICMASTRFRLGDNYSLADYRESMTMPPRQDSVEFARELTEFLGEEHLICLPCKDLDHVAKPVTIGLGDSFVGGMLPLFLTEQERNEAMEPLL